MPADMATILYDIPAKNFASDATISKINNCRAEHPKSEDAVVPVKTPERLAEEQCRREQDLAIERGEEPMRDCKRLSPPEEIPAPQKPADADAAQNTDSGNADAANAPIAAEAGGCSLQYPKSPINAWQAVVAFLLLTLPYAISSMGCRLKQK